jgi:hypothetical protein
MRNNRKTPESVQATSSIQSIPDSKQWHLRHPLPSEVWGTIFDYAGQGAGPLHPDQISRFRLLSRFITAGLDEWIRLEMDEGVKRDGVARAGSMKLAPIQVQKLAVLALSKAPAEFLQAIFNVEGDFLGVVLRSSSSRLQSVSVEPTLGEQALKILLSQLSNVTCIGASRIEWGGCLRIVDFTTMPQLTTIGDGCLRKSTIGELLLPTSLRSIGAHFLAGSSVNKVDLTRTSLETVGSYFLCEAKSDELLLSPSLKSVGDHFLKLSSVKKIDLSRTGLETIGVSALEAANSDELLLPRSLKSVGAYFLTEASVKRVDLSQTALETVGDNFLSDFAESDELVLPSSLRCVGVAFLAKSSVKKVDLSRTALETVGYAFLYGIKSDELALPRALKTVGNYCLAESSVKIVDLSHTCLETVGDYFLSSAKCDHLTLPPSLKSAGAFFLNTCHIKKVDLSCTGLDTAGVHFLFGATIDELLLPSSLEDWWKAASPPWCTVRSVVFIPQTDEGGENRKRSRQPE